MRVVIADDQLLIREGLTKVLAGCGIDVPASAGTVSGLMDAIDAHHPDAAIIDIRMPPEYASEGLHAAERLQVTHPGLAVLILSQYAEPAYAAALLADSPGRRGYLLKERVFHADQLAGALYRITAGHTVVDPAVIDTAMHTATTSNRLSALSARELEVLHLLAQGLTDRGICDRLILSPKTVASHVRHIFTKLAIPGSDHDNRRVHAVLVYLNDLTAPPARAPTPPPPRPLTQTAARARSARRAPQRHDAARTTWFTQAADTVSVSERVPERGHAAGPALARKAYTREFKHFLTD